jgi:L-fuculose-phosphate aldolase
MEHPLHLAIYNARSDVQAVVHTHSTYASALAVLRLPIPQIIDELVFQLGGQVEVADYAFPGSRELADNVVEALGPRNAVLLANHGGLAVGSTLDRAYQNALLLERAAHIFLLACAVDQKKIRTISS